MNQKTLFFIDRAIEVANQKLGADLTLSLFKHLTVIRHLESTGTPPTMTAMDTFCKANHIPLSMPTIERNTPTLVNLGVVERTTIEGRNVYHTSPLGRDYIRRVHTYIVNKKY